MLRAFLAYFVKLGMTLLVRKYFYTIVFSRYLFWYHKERMVNYDGSKNHAGGDKKEGLVSVQTITPKTIINQQKQQLSSLMLENEYHHTTKSTLTIKNATPNDAGNYTCKPSNAVEASIQVFVSEGRINCFLVYQGRK